MQTAERSAQPNTDSPAEKPLTFRQWLAAVGLALVFLAITALAVRYAELVTGRYIAAGVPPIPAVLAVLILCGWRTLARRLAPGWDLDRRQILLVFSMVCLGTLINGLYVVRAFLPHLISVQYWQSHNNAALAQWVQHLPSWYAPADADAIKRYFEGSHGVGGVPWGLWIAPLARWMLFFIALFVVACSMMALVRRQWIHAERLSFPLLYLPLTLTSESESGSKSLWRNGFFWSGFGVAALFNLLNIAHALNPAIPASGFLYSFEGQFTQDPWTPFNSVKLFFMPEAIGFGYFVPLDISFSVWFFYLAAKFAAVGGISMGYQAPGYPFMKEQSAGACLAVAALVLWGARKHLAAIFMRAFRLRPGPLTPDELEERRAVYTLIGGVAFILGWFAVSGFSLLVSAPFFAVLLCFVLVYARLRAETGAPFEFTFPYGLPKDLIVNAYTPQGILHVGGPKTWLLISAFAWLSRHHTTQIFSAYSIDGMKLAEESRMQRRWLYAGLGVALVAGLALAFWSHLDAYYAVGANLSNGGKMEYRTLVAQQEFRLMATQAATAVPRDDARMIATAIGGAVAMLLGVLRLVWVGSPFHPLGYIIATAYGDHTTAFFAMMVAWAAKAMILRAGGLPLYRKGIPFFLGLILGHYLVGGVFWPFFSLLLAPAASDSYHILLGG